MISDDASNVGSSCSLHCKKGSLLPMRPLNILNVLISRFLSMTSTVKHLQLTVSTITGYGHHQNEATTRWDAVALCRSDKWTPPVNSTLSSVVEGQGRARRQERVPHMRKDVSLPFRVVGVVRGAPDGDSFLYPSYPPIRYQHSFILMMTIDSNGRNC